MSQDELNIEHLPLQNELVKSASVSFSSEDNVLAAVLLGSLAAAKAIEYLMLTFSFLPKMGSTKSRIYASPISKLAKKSSTALKVFIMKMRSLKSIFSTI